MFDTFFSEDRVRNGSKKLTKARSTTQQGRLDTFFSVTRNVTTTTPTTKKAVWEYFDK
jgi:flap endonuclease-1